MKLSRRWVVGALWTACAVAGLVAGGSREPPTRLTFLSVGQGDCAVFQHQGATVLVDAGPSSESFDSGERLVVPGLRRLGIRTIDLVLISHPDADHIGGLPAISRHFRIGLVAIPAHFRKHEGVRNALAKSGIADRDVLWTEGRRTASLAGFQLRLDTPRWTPDRPDNDGSMFVRISGFGGSCVFSGDASGEAEAAMAGNGSEWHAQILKAGHHGSSHSTCEQWLQAVHPTFAVLSVGRNNRFGHPAPSVVGSLESHGASPLRTDRRGDVVFRLGRHGFEQD